MVREELRFYGNVQGVGFRYTAKHLAGLLGLTGWVYNDYDGTVLMEVQADSSQKIETLISMLENRTFIIVDKIDRRQIPVVDEWEFEVKE